MTTIRTAHAGLGPIGLQIVAAAADSGFAQPVAAVDIAPDVAGRSLGEVMGDARLNAVTVQGDFAEGLQGAKEGGAQVLILATGSQLPRIADQITAAVEAGLNVVSTSEELTWPWLRNPALADELDAVARRAGVSVVGTGINPGFLLDLLPLLLCRPCRRVQRVTAKRIVNVSARRAQLQKKVGSGLSPEEYRTLAAQGAIGHVGLGESAAFLAAGLGWRHDDVYETIEPVVATTACGTAEFPIAPGQVMGSHQVARVSTDEGHTIELICRMTHGEPDPRDEVIVDGDPHVQMRIEGGIFGDTATAGCTVNILQQVVKAPAGLLTVKDLPVG
jgi:hypothetical protein